MPRSSRSALRLFLVMAALFVGPAACDFDMDLSGLDLGSGTGCYMCYTDPGLYRTPFDSIPVAVTGGLTFTAVSVGARHVCALDVGGASCWGQRDIGTSDYREIKWPLATPGSGSIRRISAGDSFTCGLDDTGLASCWGINGDGQLGSGSVGIPSATPVAVVGGLHFVAISTSASMGLPHACGLTATGAAYCWGANPYGQLGDGRPALRSAAPVAVSGDHRFESISVGPNYTCGIVRGDGAWCWGLAANALLGEHPVGVRNCAPGDTGGTILCNTVPVRIAGTDGFTSVSTGGSHACALDANGAAYCWGVNSQGQLGTGGQLWGYTPAAVSTALRFKAIATGADATCGLTAAGAAYCWGANSLGQLGDGTTWSRPLPTKVMTDLAFATISLGFQTACALTVDGAAYCWGSNEAGKLGKGV